MAYIVRNYINGVALMAIIETNQMYYKTTNKIK